MRILEVVLIVLNGLIIILRFFPRRMGWNRVLAPAALVVMTLHLVIEQGRWQMIPLYALTLILCVANLPAWRKAATARPRLIWTVLGLVVLVLFSLPPVLFPVPSLIPTTGPYKIGTLSFDWTDETRVETLSGTTGGKRRIMVQVWYPAAPAAGAQTGPYLNDLVASSAALSKPLKIPAFLLGHLSLARTQSYPNAPVAAGSERFPVLIFSHGWTGIRVQNTYQMEELASHGYIVFAPEHAYGAAVTTFSDGTTILNRPQLLPGNVSEAEYNQAARTLGLAWAGDLRFIFDQIEKIAAGQLAAPFQDRLDLTRMGILGHSTGGGAAVEACYMDARCKAGLAMDAWLQPYAREIPEKGLKVPFFFFQSEKWPSGANALLVPPLYDHMQAPAWRLTIAGSKHFDFSDVGLLTPLAPAIGIKGPINGPYALKMINAYSLAFFNQSLRGQSSPLLERAAPEYPEIRFEKR